MEGYIAEIRMFAGNFAPRGWQFCNGQILAIASNTALFSLLGTTFGGNGQTTFGLPDFRGRVAMGTGAGPGLPPITLGEMAGEMMHTLIQPEMPAHNHPATAVLSALSTGGSAGAPGDAYSAASTARDNIYAPAADTKMNAGAVAVTIGLAGASQGHNNVQPYLAMNYIICVEGIYPSRN